MKFRIITQNVQSIQRYSFPKKYSTVFCLHRDHPTTRVLIVYRTVNLEMLYLKDGRSILFFVMRNRFLNETIPDWLK